MADREKLPSEVEIEAFNKQAIAKIRDAKVGPKEEYNFNAILPKATDNPSVYQAKLKASKMYLQNLENKPLKELKGSAVSENEMKRFKNSMPKKAKGGMSKKQLDIAEAVAENSLLPGGTLIQLRQAAKAVKKAKGGEVVIGKGGDYIKDLL
jgi:hypothetical protein